MTDLEPPGPVAGPTGQERSNRSQQQWILSLLPAFPLVLLVLRLWYLSRQDLATMLLLVQYVSPLGLITALLITLVWVVPAGVLTLRALGTLLLISAPSQADATRSLLAVVTLRMPDWVVVLAAVLAALTWQMRFLPTLLMIIIAILGLTGWQRHREDRLVLGILTMGVPAVVALLAYTWLAPAIRDAVQAAEITTALLLILPPGLALLLTGPVPRPFARLVTHWAATAAALVAPFAVGALFMRAPILPDTALEVQPTAGATDKAPSVVRGRVIIVDDRMVTLLDGYGRVRFLIADTVLSRTLCPEAEQVPSSVIDVRGWYAEDTALEWMAPKQLHQEPDPRCQGRPESAG